MKIIRKDSPHRLRITKMQASHKKAYENWQEDCHLLESLAR